MKIIIKIDEDSTASAETFGIIGKECVDKLDLILGDLLEVDAEEIKPDYFSNKRIVEQKNVLKNG